MKKTTTRQEDDQISDEFARLMDLAGCHAGQLEDLDPISVFEEFTGLVVESKLLRAKLEKALGAVIMAAARRGAESAAAAIAFAIIDGKIDQKTGLAMMRIARRAQLS